MGGSVSTNATSIVINSVIKVSSKIAQTTTISYDSSQVIYIKHIKGDVIISGNIITQRAYVNMQALFNAMSSESARQNLALELAQSAKALTSGLNLGQFSDAENDMNIFIKTSIDLTNEISQTCAAMAKQEQEIYIQYVEGSVVIKNNLFEQIADIMSNCLQTSISNSDALQSIILKLTQDSSATSQGISEWAIVAIAAVLVGAPTIGAVVIGKQILNYLFPLIMVAGVVMIIVYYYTKTPNMPMKAYSTFIENTPGCLAQPASPTPVLTYKTAEEAGNYCSKSTDCRAFDWKGLDISETGSYKLTVPPVSKFYTSVSDGCRSDIETDNVNMLRAPVMYFGSGAPPQNIPGLLKGDCWINTDNAMWYQLNLNWEQKDYITKDKFSKLTVQKDPPTSQTGAPGEYVVQYSQDSPDYFYIYTQSSLYNSPWFNHGSAPGPGLFASAPPVTNASGVKETNSKEWLLYGGIAAIVVGLGGTVVTLFIASKQQESKQDSTQNVSKQK